MAPSPPGGVWGCRFSPTPAYLKAMAASEMHHLVVFAAPLELVAHLRIGFAQGYEGIELPNLFKELLELGFGHGLTEWLRGVGYMRVLIMRQRMKNTPANRTSSWASTCQPNLVSRGLES